MNENPIWHGIKDIQALSSKCDCSREAVFVSILPGHMNKLKRQAKGVFCAGAVLAVSAAQLAAGDWPQWRGPNRDGHVAAGEVFPQALPPAPQPVWQKNIGGGFS